MNLYQLVLIAVIVATDTLTSSKTDYTMECTAVIPYSSLNLFPEFYEKERSIVIGGKRYLLKQQWDSNGVSGVLWGSAVVLAKYIHDNPVIVRGKKVLELGAGLGLPSMVASKCGAENVLCTDQQLAVQLLKENIAYNIPNALNVNVSVVDWKSDKLDATYDVILGADLVYNQELFEPLKVILNECSTSSSVIIFASRIRYKKDELFYEGLNTTGFNVQEVLFDPKTDVHLYRILKK